MAEETKKRKWHRIKHRAKRTDKPQIAIEQTLDDVIGPTVLLDAHVSSGNGHNGNGHNGHSQDGKPVKTTKRNWLKIGGGVPIALLGVGGMLGGNAMANPIVIVLGAGIAFGGGLLVWNGWKVGGQLQVEGATVKRKKQGPIDSLVITKDTLVPDAIATETFHHPVKVLNFGKFFAVARLTGDSIQDGILESATVSEKGADDFSPEEMGALLRQDNVTAYLSYLPTSNAKNITLGILAGIIVALVLGLVII